MIDTNCIRIGYNGWYWQIPFYLFAIALYFIPVLIATGGNRKTK
jgi:hypothetical protein